MRPSQVITWWRRPNPHPQGYFEERWMSNAEWLWSLVIKWPAVLYSQSRENELTAILECFIDLKSSVWFAWGQKTKPCSLTLQRELFFSSTAAQGVENTKWPAVLYRIHRNIRVNHKTKTNTLHRVGLKRCAWPQTNTRYRSLTLFSALRWSR